MPKVLIVDDSALMRKHLTGLLKEAGFEVVTAKTGKEAVEQVHLVQPDVITLDINMPEMDGLTALSEIMTSRPTPVVMVSSLTEKGALATLEALALGAVDYVAKPGGTISLSIDEIAALLVDKVSSALTMKVKSARMRTAIPKPAPPPHPKPRPLTDLRGRGGALPGLVIIGVSTGGPRTLEEILPAIPADFDWPILVAQHMPASFTGAFAGRMNTMCALQVKEASAVDEIEAGTVYIAKGGTDMVVSTRATRLYVTSRPEARQHLWHPSVDVLVGSALDHVSADRLICVQLTGMGYDGAQAIARVKRQGGRTIAESEESAVVFGMPKELIALDGASTILPSSKIASQILRWAR